MNSLNNPDIKLTNEQIALKNELLEIGFTEEYVNISIKISDNQEDAINR